MTFTPKTWKDRASELAPRVAETLADWEARVAAYSAANPSLVTPLDAAAVIDIEQRIANYADTVAGIPGPTGPAGPVGPSGTGFVWKGNYNAGTSYVVGDVVFYTGTPDGFTSYIATAPSTGVTPANAASQWDGIVIAGPAGPAGATGATGSTGATGATGATGPAMTVKDETVTLTNRATIDFQGAGVTAADDSVNAKTVVTIPGGAGGGGITTISAATDVDATTKQSGGTNIRARRWAWWQSSSGKLRFDAPPGMVNVMDPYYGAATRDRTNSTATTAAIINATKDAASLYNGGAGQTGGGGGAVFFPAGTYLVNDSILSSTNFIVEQSWHGEGQLSSIIQMDVTANLVGGTLKPIVDLHQPQGGQPARFYPHDLLFRTSWTFGAAANFYPNESALISIGSGDLAKAGQFFVWYAYGNGMELTRSKFANQPGGLFPNGTKPSANDRWDFFGPHINLSKRHGLYLDNGGAFCSTLYGGEYSGNGGAGVYCKGAGLNQGVLILDGLKMEQCGDYSIYLESMQNATIRGCYAFQAPIYLDEDTTECTVIGNNPYDHLTESDEVEFFSYGGQVVDNGFNNVIGPNGGTGYPAPGIRAGKTIQQLLPSSRVPDGDMKQRSLTGVTATSATVTKGYTGSDFRRSVPQIGGGSSLTVVQSASATPGGPSWTFPVVATECYLVEVIWNGGSATTPGMRVRVLNGATPFHTTPIQGLSGNRAVLQGGGNNDEPRPQLLRFVVKIPTGVTTATIEAYAAQATGGVQNHYIHSVGVHKIPLLNANMQGFTSGVIDNWAVDLSGGTLSQEVVTIDTARGYANALRMHVNASSTLSVIQTVAPIDPRKFYLQRARYQIPTAGQTDTLSSMRRRVKMRWGGFTGGGNFQQYGIRARKTGVWDDIMHILKPSGTAVAVGSRDRISFGINSGLAMDVILQEFYVLPLKDDVGLKSYVSPPLSLASSGNVVVGVPTIDSVIRSVTLVNATALTSVAVNVGTNATAAYYGTSTPAATIDTVTDVTLARTDVRAGVPIRLSTAGSGAGSVVAIVEYE